MSAPPPKGKPELVKPLYVCIPVFNGGPVIQRTLKNILKQDFQDFTVLVYNDGSKDRTAEFVQKMADEDSRVRLVDGGPNKGRGAARQALLTLAADGMIAWQDADDLWHRSKLGAQLEARKGFSAALDNDDFVLISTYDRVAQKDGQDVVSTHVPPEAFDTDFIFGSEFHCPFHLQAVIGPASSFIDAGGFDPELNWWEDLDVALKLLKAGYKIVGHACEQSLATYHHSLKKARGPVVEAGDAVLRNRFREFAAGEGFDIDKIFQLRATGYVASAYLQHDRFAPALAINLRALNMLDAADEAQFRRIANNILHIVERVTAKQMNVPAPSDED
jgi:glycosyltransferase involved in cell wall biosynthesis